MNLATRLVKAVRQGFEGRLARLGPVGKQFAVGLNKDLPPGRDIGEFLQGYSTMPWMRAVLSKIAFGVANARWMVQGIKGPTGKGFVKSPIALLPLDARRKAMQEIGSKSFPEHPLPALLANPCPLFPGIDGAMLWQVYLDLIGECFQLVERQDGVPVALYPIPPHWVKKTPTQSDPQFHVEYQRFRQNFPMQDILWDRDLDPLFPYGRGVGIMRTLGDELDANEYAAKLINYQFYNMNRPDMLVTIEDTDDTKLQAFKEVWTGSLQGLRRAFRTFFWNKPVSVEKIQSDFVHSQLDGMVRWLRDVIHQVPGVPPEMLGILDQSNRATITAAEYIMAKHVIEPRLEKRRGFIQMQIVPMFDDRILLEYESPVPRDREMALKAAQVAPVGMTVDDWRDLMDLEKLEGKVGKLFVVTPGAKLITDLKDLATEKEAPAAPEPVPPQFQPKPQAPEEPVPAESAQAAASVTIPVLKESELSPDARILLQRAQSIRMDPVYIARLLCILHEKDVAWSEPDFGPVGDRDYGVIDQFLGDWNGRLLQAV